MTTHTNPVAMQLVHEILSADSFAEPRSPAPHVAVLIPCYNEQAAIATVIADFRQALPNAAFYVYDNNSTDETAAIAAGRGRDRSPRDLCRARATSCGACSPTSKRMPTCSSMATAPTTRPRRRAWSSSCS